MTAHTKCRGLENLKKHSVRILGFRLDCSVWICAFTKLQVIGVLKHLKNYLKQALTSTYEHFYDDVFIFGAPIKMRLECI